MRGGGVGGLMVPELSDNSGTTLSKAIVSYVGPAACRGTVTVRRGGRNGVAYLPPLPATPAPSLTTPGERAE